MANTKKLISFNKGDGLPQFLQDLFYGSEGTDDRMCLRSNKGRGLTRSCYLAEKLFIVRYVLKKYYEFNFELHSRFESIIIALTGQYNTFAATQYFADQLKGEKLVAYISQKMEDFIKQPGVQLSNYMDEHSSKNDAIINCSNRLRFLTFLFSSQFDGRTQVLTAETVDDFLVKSDKYPIAMAFGYNKQFSRGPLYEIDHWFVLYHRKIFGATGLGGVQISFFGSKEISTEEFKTFLNSMNEYNEDEASKEEKKQFFDQFITENMLPESYHVQSFIQKSYGKSDEGEQRDSHIPTHFPSERDSLLASYNDLSKYSVYILNGYNDDTSYVDTITKAVECLSTLPIMKNKVEVPIPRKRDQPLSEDEMFKSNFLSTLFPKKVQHTKRRTIKTPFRKGISTKQVVSSSSSSRSRSRSRTPVKNKTDRLGILPDVAVGGSLKKKRRYKYSKNRTRKYKKN